VAALAGARCLPRLLNVVRLGRFEGHDNDGLNHLITEVVESAPLHALPYLLEMATSTSEDVRSDAAWLLGFLWQSVDPSVLRRTAGLFLPKLVCSRIGDDGRMRRKRLL